MPQPCLKRVAVGGRVPQTPCPARSNGCFQVYVTDHEYLHCACDRTPERRRPEGCRRSVLNIKACTSPPGALQSSAMVIGFTLFPARSTEYNLSNISLTEFINTMKLDILSVLSMLTASITSTPTSGRQQAAYEPDRMAFEKRQSSLCDGWPEASWHCWKIYAIQCNGGLDSGYPCHGCQIVDGQPICTGA